ncbi:MAG: glycogen debranching enzyme GlgX, partial [Pseudomonadota bacterium]
TRSVNFVAAHDGFSLWDTTAYAHKHNHANGEDNRDGHNENHSWNHGQEGERADLVERRRADVIAMLALTYLSRGTVMLTMGDASGRTQSGNNNAYCQDNALTWFDWAARDPAIEAAARALGALRQAVGQLRDAGELSADDVVWLRPDGAPMAEADWAGQVLMMRLGPVLLCINRSDAPVTFQPPGGAWTPILGAGFALAPQTLHVFQDQPHD